MKVLAYTVVFMLVSFIISCSGTNSDSLKPAPTLTDQEISDLQFLFEEEKMARDLYRYGLETYGGNQFNNISESEQRHMDAVAVLLENYNVEIPEDLGRGTYVNTFIQELYDTLFSRFETSEAQGYIAAKRHHRRTSGDKTRGPAATPQEDR